VCLEKLAAVVLLVINPAVYGSSTFITISSVRYNQAGAGDVKYWKKVPLEMLMVTQILNRFLSRFINLFKPSGNYMYHLP
jgi:hypothetical protein